MVYRFTCTDLWQTGTPARCRWPHVLLKHTCLSPAPSEERCTGASRSLSTGAGRSYPEHTHNTKRLGLHGHRTVCGEGELNCVFDTFSVALPSIQVCTTRCPSQDTARCMMDMGRELSHGGRRERMYWPLRTVWMITVPSCDTHKLLFTFLYHLLLPEIRPKKLFNHLWPL